MSSRKTSDPIALLREARRLLMVHLDAMKRQPEQPEILVGLHESLILEIDGAVRSAGRKRK